jgi:hypothetical protein
MRLLANHPLPRRLLAGLALSAGLTGLLAPAASAATAESTPGTDGWVRPAHLSNPGTWTLRAVGDSEHTSRTIKLVPDCIHTIVILDDPGHLKIDDLLDSAGSTEIPGGGVETGLGGTAPRPASPAAPWLVTVGAGGLLMLAGGFAIQRVRHTPQRMR